MFYKPQNRLSMDSVRQILALKDAIEPEMGTIISGDGSTTDAAPKDELRKTEVRWIHRDMGGNLFQIADEMAAEYSHKLNIFGDLTVVGSIQLGTYYPGYFYSWHFDGDVREADAHRIMTTSVLLSDNFTGGRLEFKSPGAPKLKKVGDFIVFSTDEEHRVQPIRSGLRDSLVIWWGRHA